MDVKVILQPLNDRGRERVEKFIIDFRSPMILRGSTARMKDGEGEIDLKVGWPLSKLPKAELTSTIYGIVVGSPKEPLQGQINVSVLVPE